MKHLFILVFITLTFVCEGQIDASINFDDIDINDTKEIKGLFYLKADTTLVTGRVVRFNKKNEPKRYVIVKNGKPDNFGWTYVKEKYETPKESELGDILTAAAVTTGVIMAVSGNDINVPIPDSNNPKNYNNRLLENDMTHLIDYNIEIATEANDVMLQRNEISNNITSISKKRNESSEKSNKDVQLEIKINYVDDNKNIMCEKYYSNGILESKGVYIEGERDGIWEEFYENGQLKRETHYKNGVKDGLWEQYHDNGQLWGKGYYKDGRTIGEWNYYGEKGELLLTENYDK